MEIVIKKQKNPWYSKIVPYIGNIFGAMVSVFVLIILYIPMRLSKSSWEKPRRRNIKTIVNNELNWKLIFDKKDIKVYEANICEPGLWDYPKELKYMDLAESREICIKKFKTEPVIKELEDLFFSELYPYDDKNTYLEYHNGIYIIAYPKSKDDPEKHVLYHLGFDKKNLIKIKDDMPRIDKVSYPDKQSIKMIHKSWDTKETILIREETE